MHTAHSLPEFFETERLVLRAPRTSDAASLFEAYTQDPGVTRYLIWRPRTSLAATEEFIAGCLRDRPGGSRLPYVLAPRNAPARVIGMLEARPRFHLVDIRSIRISVPRGGPACCMHDVDRVT